MMTIDIAQVMARLERLALLDMSPWLAAVGQQQEHAAQRRIRDSKVDPEGAPWAPWSRFTQEERAEKGNAAQGLLWDSGRLMLSIYVDEGADSVSIGTSVEYAKELQEGRYGMVERPFLGWSPADTNDLEFSAVRFIEALL